MSRLIELADEFEDFDRRLKRIIDNGIGLSAEGQGIAIAMLVTLKLALFKETYETLRTLSQGGKK